MRECIQRAVATIRERYDEPLRLDDLARAATMSKFHFLRTFRDFTGVTPARYLSAVRIYEAKRRLCSTGLDVAGISVEVGYGSLGTFTRRFTGCVGLPPTIYRRVARGEAAHPWTDSGPATFDCRLGTVSGTVSVPPSASSPIFIGLFQSRIPQGQPVARTAVARPGPWRISGVPSGTWYLLAATTAAEEPPKGERVVGEPPAVTGGSLLVDSSHRLQVLGCADTRVDLTLSSPEWTDPPLLIAVPGLEPFHQPAVATRRQDAR